MNPRSELRSFPSFLALIVGAVLPVCAPAWAESPSPSALPALAEITAHEDQRLSGPELISFLDNPDPSLRGRAALAVGRIGRPEDVKSLIPLLKDPDTEVRCSAAFALGEIEDSTAAGPLIRLLEEGTEPDAPVRALAVEGLGKLRTGAEACRRALGDSATDVRAAALLAAWRIPVAGCLDEVLQLSRAADPELRWPAAYCLMRLAGAPASGRTAIPEAAPLTGAQQAQLENRLRALLTDSEVRVRLQAARGLAAFADTSASGELSRLSSDPDWRVRAEAIRSLAAAGRREIPWNAILPFLQDANPNVRISAIEALATIGPEKKVLPRLEGFLSDPRSRVEQTAYLSLLARYRRAGHPLPGEAADTVTELAGRMLQRKDWSLRIMAADAVDLLPLETSLPILKKMMQDEPRVAKGAVEPLLQRRVRSEKGAILSRMRSDLKSILGATDPILRSMAIGAVASILADSTLHPQERDWADFEALLTQAQRFSVGRDREADVRRAVVEAASAHSGRKGMQDVLNECCSDPNYVVRREAGAALRRAGVKPPRDPEPATAGTVEYGKILEWSWKDHWAVIATEGGDPDRASLLAGGSAHLLELHPAGRLGLLRSWTVAPRGPRLRPAGRLPAGRRIRRSSATRSAARSTGSVSPRRHPRHGALGQGHGEQPVLPDPLRSASSRRTLHRFRKDRRD